MLKKKDDPALNWALMTFGVVTVLATVLVASWGSAFPANPGPAQTIWLSLLLGTILGGAVGCVVFVAVGFHQWDAEVRRVTQEQERDLQRRTDIARALGPRYRSIVETTLAAVRHDISESEAASAGLLGDIDFDADIRGITDNLLKAHGLQKVANTLAALDKPSAEDRKILAEAKATVAKLETAALNRVELIAKCATEAQLVDKSLHDERQDAKTSAQRAELHAKLAAML